MDERNKNRAPFQVLVLPYRCVGIGQFEFAIFKRSDGEFWQFVAGGGEGRETPLETAGRELFEETGIQSNSEFIELDTRNTIPVVGVTGEFTWGEDVFVIPEFAFGIEVGRESISLSQEHLTLRWVDYQTAISLLKWDSNRNALWELHTRLLRKVRDKK